MKGGVGAPIREEQRAHRPRHAEGIEELPGELPAAAPAVTRRIRTRRAGVQRLYLLHSRSHAASAASSHRICSGEKSPNALSEPGTIEKSRKASILPPARRRVIPLPAFGLYKNLTFLYISIDIRRKRAIMQAIEQSMIEARMLRVAPLKDGRNRWGERSSRRRVSDFLIRYIWVVGEYPADCRVSGELSGHLGDYFRGHEQYLLCS